MYTLLISKFARAFFRFFSHTIMYKNVFCAGVVTTKRLLDRETVPDHRLTVIALDGGGLTCRSQVHVVLTDVNDNAPKFTSRGHYTATIPEDSAVGTPVVRVAAIDSDLGINRRVRYSLVAGEGDSVRSSLQIDPVSGVLTLLQTVDREERPVYNFTVMASDQVKGIQLYFFKSMSFEKNGGIVKLISLVIVLKTL